LIRSRIPYLVIPLIAGIFFLTRNPHVNFGDSLGFLVFALQGFDPGTNATSHFLYNNLNHLALLAFPGFPPIAVLTLLSLLYGVATLIQLFRAAQLLTPHASAAALAVVSLGLGFTFWRQAVMIEVYTLNGFWVASILLHMLKAWKDPSRDQALAVSLWLGLALLTHIQNVLLLPAYLLFLYARPRQSMVNTLAGLASLAGLFSMLIILPLALDTHSVRAVFFEDQYQQALLGLNLGQLPAGILRSLGYLVYNYHLFLPFVCHGSWLAWRHHRQVLILLAVSGLPFWLFAMRYNVSDNYVFFLSPYLALSLLAVYSFDHWVGRLRPHAERRIALLAVAVAPLVYALTLFLALQIPQLSAWDEAQAHKGGLKYYLWPGQAQSIDPLLLAREIYLQSGEELPAHWQWFDRYEYAIRYQKMNGTLPHR
jgi:hypothetical protein